MIVPAADGCNGSPAKRYGGPLLWIPDYRYEWPQAMVLDNPLSLPAGTTVMLFAEPHTSAATARLSLLPTRAASSASRSPTRTPAPPRK